MKINTHITALAICAAMALPMQAQKAKTASAAPNTAQLEAAAAEALMVYDLPALNAANSKWGAALKKSTPALEASKQRALNMRNMLERVEKITIIDAYDVAKKDFFKNYLLSPDAGTLSGNGDAVTYTPALGREQLTTIMGADSTMTLASVGLLDDGTADKPVPINLGNGHDTGYPFMLTDGSTLYFAIKDAPDGLGGYDIYMTRRDAETGDYLEPVNLGMPYNSPGDDYLMALDDATGVGWWATDRATDTDTVTVYVFERGSGTRVNYPADGEDLRDKAFITTPESTQPEGYDAVSRMADLRTQVEAPRDMAVRSAGDFALSLGNGRVLRSLNQFGNTEARQMMTELLQAQKQLDAMTAKIADMRRRYTAGDLSLVPEITQAENALNKARTAIQANRNAIIRLETTGTK